MLLALSSRLSWLKIDKNMFPRYEAELLGSTFPGRAWEREKITLNMSQVCDL